MRQVGGEVGFHAGLDARVMFTKVGHQVTRLVALTLAVTDHDKPPAARNRRRYGVEEMGVCGVGLGAVGIVLSAVDVMLKVVQFLWCRTHFATNGKDPCACMVDNDDQILRGGLQRWADSVGHEPGLSGKKPCSRGLAQQR
jgi:hypothetical protein